MFPALQTVVRSSFSRDDGPYSSGCSPPLLSAKSTASINRTLSDITAAFSSNNVLDTFRRGGAQVLELLHPKAGPEMGSQDAPHPFGYDFHEGYPEGTAIPSSNNEPLLNLQEHNYLTNFWNANSQQQPNSNEFQSLQTLGSADDSTGFSWQMLMSEPPPTVRDIAAASMPQASVSQQHAHGVSPHLSMAETPLMLSTNGVVDGASLMHQAPSGHNGLRHMSDTGPISPAFHIPRGQSQAGHPQQRRFQSASLSHGPTSLAQSPVMPGVTSSTDMDSLRAVAHPGMMPALQTNNMPPSMSFGAPHSAPVGEHVDQSVNPRLYHFGSDNNFNATGFQPSSDFERHDYRAELISSELRRLKPINRTPVATREHSPDPANLKVKVAAERDALNGKIQAAREPGHKRKRSSESAASESEDEDGQGRASSLKKRRSSGPAAARPKRENLSEVQKRRNHIASEQKRRAQIKLGFDELNRIVPEIRDSGLSKSGMLMEACNFLEQLQLQTIKLSQRLGQP